MHWVRKFKRNMDYLHLKNAIHHLSEEQGYQRAIKEMAVTLSLQGFSIYPVHDREGKTHLGNALYDKVKSIALDASATGTHFFSVSAVHFFADNVGMPLTFHFLYNKEAATLELHSVNANWKDLQQKFVPDQFRVLPEPATIRSFLEHKATTREALALWEHKTSPKVLSH